MRRDWQSLLTVRRMNIAGTDLLLCFPRQELAGNKRGLKSQVYQDSKVLPGTRYSTAAESLSQGTVQSGAWQCLEVRLESSEVRGAEGRSVQRPLRIQKVTGRLGGHWKKGSEIHPILIHLLFHEHRLILGNREQVRRRTGYPAMCAC